MACWPSLGNRALKSMMLRDEVCLVVMCKTVFPSEKNQVAHENEDLDSICFFGGVMLYFLALIPCHSGRFSRIRT